MAISLGVYMKGETTPQRLTYRYLSNAGTAIAVTGYQVVAVVTAPDDTTVEVAGQVDDGATGTVSIGWTEDMTDQVGPWSMVIWAGDGADAKIASPPLFYNVADDETPDI